MKTPGLILSISAAIVVLGSWRCAEAESIVVVYDSGDPTKYVSFLRTIYGDGIDIAAVEGGYTFDIDEYRRDELRNANLVIVLRDTDSGKYAGNAEFWNTLATPMLLHSPYLARRGKWNWLDDNQDPVGHAAKHAHAYDPDHSFYQGVTIAEGHVQIYEDGCEEVDINPTSGVGYGTLVASDYNKGQHRPVIVTWGTSAEYYYDAGYVPGADRVLFSTAKASEFFDAKIGASDNGRRLLRNSLVSLYAGPTIARYTFDDEHFIGKEQFSPEFSAEGVTVSNLADDLADPGSNDDMSLSLLSSIDRDYPDLPVLKAVPKDEAVAAGPFFEFKVSPEAGCKLSLHNLMFDVSKGGESGPRTWFLRTSLDKFATEIASSVVNNYSEDSMESFSVNLTGSGYQDLDGDIVFRMYMYTNGTGKSLEFDNLVLLGSVAKHIPEPGTLTLAMICVVLIVVCGRKWWWLKIKAELDCGVLPAAFYRRGV